MGKKVKVVLDTNVWISIFMKKTLGREFSRLFKQGKIEVFISEKILREISRVLTYPKITRLLEDVGISMKEVLKHIVDNSTLVKPVVKLRVIKEDVADNIILECAYQDKVDFIVSGDKHLLKLKKFKGIRIIAPRELLDIF
ncbi:MAG: putative toxin-antitoxin system toxin component, PIN family [Candidatus Aenigmarchaeota archaeon]|nr:putative toxin-antitoxin system toxin component, PIN family [Candidatus Aenigmarchaeota archaeon]